MNIKMIHYTLIYQYGQNVIVLLAIFIMPLSYFLFLISVQLILVIRLFHAFPA
jgi:hypothetical protein